MHGRYVLDFSDPIIAEFFEEESIRPHLCVYRQPQRQLRLCAGDSQGKGLDLGRI
jgi:hypothetical protein